MTLHAPDKQKYLESAKISVDYYQRLAHEQGSSWILGLYMAKQWLRLLEQAPYDLEQLKFLAITLEAERTQQGSEWHHMWRCVDNWLHEIILYDNAINSD